MRKIGKLVLVDPEIAGRYIDKQYKCSKEDEKPKEKTKITCTRDCLNCPLSDCIMDDLTDSEIALSERLDRIAENDRKWDSTATLKTKKVGRPRKLFRKCDNEFYKKEKAEKQKEYYHKHKEERLNYQKNYYKEHIKNPEYAQANRERALAYYKRMSDEERAEYNAKQKEYYKKRKAAHEAEKG